MNENEWGEEVEWEAVLGFRGLNHQNRNGQPWQTSLSLSLSPEKDSSLELEPTTIMAAMGIAAGIGHHSKSAMTWHLHGSLGYFRHADPPLLLFDNTDQATTHNHLMLKVTNKTWILFAVLFWKDFIIGIGSINICY